MLQLFKSNSPINYIIAFFVMLLLWGYKFIFMPTGVDTGGMQSFFFRLQYESLNYQYIYTVVAFLSAFGFACYCSRANFNNFIVASANQLPTFFYVVLTGTAINAQRCIPELFASIFISFAVLEIFKTYNRREALRESLNVGLFTAFAVILAHKFIFLLPVLLIILFLVKPVTWRDIIAFCISFCTIIAITCCLVWLYGDFQSMVEATKNEFSKIIVGEKYNITTLLIHTPLFFAVVATLVSIIMLKSSIRTSESRFQIAMVVLLIYYSILLMSPFMSNEAVWLVYFPLTFLLSNIVVYARKRSLANLIFYSIIALIVISQFIQKVYFDTIF